MRLKRYAINGGDYIGPAMGRKGIEITGGLDSTRGGYDRHSLFVRAVLANEDWFNYTGKHQVPSS